MECSPPDQARPCPKQTPLTGISKVFINICLSLQTWSYSFVVWTMQKQPLLSAKEHLLTLERAVIVVRTWKMHVRAKDIWCHSMGRGDNSPVSLRGIVGPLVHNMSVSLSAKTHCTFKRLPGTAGSGDGHSSQPPTSALHCPFCHHCPSQCCHISECSQVQAHLADTDFSSDFWRHTCTWQ